MAAIFKKNREHKLRRLHYNNQFSSSFSDKPAFGTQTVNTKRIGCQINRSK